MKKKKEVIVVGGCSRLISANTQYAYRAPFKTLRSLTNVCAPYRVTQFNNSNMCGERTTAW